MLYIGIDLGGTNIAAGLVDENGKIILKGSVPTKREREYPEIIKDMAELVLRLIDESGLGIDSFKSIGVGSPGTPDCDDGEIVYANNIRFRNVPLRKELQKYINLPVYVNNDANVAAYAETLYGAAKDAATAVAVTIGTGIGGGVVVDGRILSGFNNAASELGHMVVDMDGEECSCGRRGCWEVYASATACIKMTRKAAEENPYSLINNLVNGDLSAVDAKTVFDAAKQGDDTAQKVVSQYIKNIGEGLANIINIFQPEVIVIGGGVCKEGEYLLAPLRKYIEEHTFAASQGIKTAQLKTAQMGNDAGIVGAAMLGK
ncbi:MAG TPA: ROK family protein [Ruminiclostridium sp.]|nr:ROK family protein [Ruminiclostridium sp.]